MSLGDLFTSRHYRKRPSIVTTPDDVRSFSLFNNNSLPQVLPYSLFFCERARDAV